MSLHDIAKIFGGRDHSTAIHSVNTLRDLMEVEQKVVEDVEAIKSRIKML